MKIHIAYKFKDGPWGGGNQFLKALRDGLVKKGVYSVSLEEANIILFDSYQNIRGLFLSWLLHHSKKRIYRLGPVFHLHRGKKWKLVDIAVIFAANFFADLVIFQSRWSYKQALELGFRRKKKYFIIPNAVDDSLFYRKQYPIKNQLERVQLVYSSWSSNKNKGFSYLKFLDEKTSFWEDLQVIWKCPE